MLSHYLLAIVATLTLCRAAGEEWPHYAHHEDIRGSPVERDFLSHFGAATPSYEEGLQDPQSGPSIQDTWGRYASSSGGVHPNQNGDDTDSYHDKADDLSGELVSAELLSIAQPPHDRALPDHPQGEADTEVETMVVTPPRGTALTTAVPVRSSARRSRAANTVLTGFFDDDYWLARGSQSVDQDLRALVGSLCRRKGLWVGMSPRELAAGLAEVKVEIGRGLSMRIGLMAANYVHRSPQATREYVSQLQSWCNKFRKNLGRCKRNFASGPYRNMTQHQRSVLILASLRFLRDRETYLDHVRQYKTEEEVLDEEARQIWAALERSPELAEAAYQYYAGMHLHLFLPPQHIPIELIELVSRNVQIPPHSREEVADYLRRFLLRDLHKTAEEVDVFNKARNDWLRTVQITSQRTVEVRQDGDGGDGGDEHKDDVDVDVDNT